PRCRNFAKGYLPEALVNYLALIGWSPGGGEELVPIDELARRFAIEDVGRSPGVFDEEKLAWVNRHYLKRADARRLLPLVRPFLQRAAFVTQPNERGLAFIEELLPLATGSVDRLDEVPARLRFVFRFDPEQSLENDEVRKIVDEPGARDVIAALTDEL